MLFLSKSKYVSALQCPKMLWLFKNMPDEFDKSVMNQAVLDTGNEVGDLAMGLFGSFVEVPYSDNKANMISETTRLLNAGTPVVCEASFAWQGLFCSVDILKNLGGGDVELYEVKSSTEVKDVYLEDATFQCYVLKQLGYRVQRACIVHINNQYVRHGALNLQQLFCIRDVTPYVANRIDGVGDTIARLETYMQQTQEPGDDIGMHCFKPYDCGFFGYCTRCLPKPNVFDVSGMHKSTMVKCYQNGEIDFAALHTCDALNGKQHLQVEHELYHYEPRIRKQNIKDYLATLFYPLYFLDFETFNPAIPQFDDTKPYQQIPFQYSLHYILHEGGELLHEEFLAQPGTDPRRALAEQLCRDIPQNVCVTAYNMSFEKGRIRELAKLFPDLSQHLMNIHDSIRDLMLPFRDADYYDRAMQGSYSIKHVLPALFPDDPALDYSNLEGVHNGGEASAAFERMAAMTAQEQAEYRKNLLKYCGLDTFAMVKVWEKLKEAAC